MEKIFLHLLNLSITASYVVLAVILLRSLLFKAPKWISCLLWAVVGIRLAVPVSIESIFSLIPSREPIPRDIMTAPTPEIHTGISVVNQTVNPIITDTFTPDPVQSVNSLQVFFSVATIVWLVGLCITLLWGCLSYLKLRKTVSASIQLRDNVYFCDHIGFPFILGVFRPRIYLPSNLDEEETRHVIAHERAHLQRKDHLWKPIGFLLLAIYWFNPLLWLAYILLCRDIEAACDQRVVSNMTDRDRKNYSYALLSCSTRRFSIGACPLAFGEVGVKSRIKSVLNYKKPALWIILISLILCIALAVCFLTVPKDTDNNTTDPNYGITDPDGLSYEQRYLMSQHPEYFGLNSANGLDVYVCQFAPENYYFYLFEHSDTTTTRIDMMSMKGTVGAATMRLILDTYDVTREDITVIPFQHPLSSYIISTNLIPEGESPEDTETRRNAYREMILDMLFGEEMLVSIPIYDSMQFDVDGDGRQEHCTLGFGMTSGVFTFTFTASEGTVGKWVQEYYTVFCSEWYKQLSFKQCDDGVVRVQGIDQNDEIHLFDISIVDGNIYLTENGVPIGDVVIPITIENGKEDQHILYDHEKHVDFESKDLSAADRIVITDGTSGAKAEITDPKKLSAIINAIKTIEGTDPISNKGFYGFHYYVVLYSEEEQLFSFGLFADTDSVALTYGLYETAGGHAYPCRYTLTGGSYEDIDRVLRNAMSGN